MAAPQPSLKPVKKSRRWIWGILILLLVLGFIILGVDPIGPGTVGHPGPNVAMQQSREIGEVLLEYAKDHGGAYPTGSSSTEVFRSLSMAST